MVVRSWFPRRLLGLLSGAAVMAGVLPAAYGQTAPQHKQSPVQLVGVRAWKTSSAPCDCPPPIQWVPPTVSPGTPTTPPTTTPPTTTPPTTTPEATPPTTTPDVGSDVSAPTGDMGGVPGEESGSVGGGYFSAANYIDSAIPRSQIRFRFDSMFDSNRPDRGEYFYAKCGCFRGAPLPFTDPGAAGPPMVERRIDSTQEYWTYVEGALSDRFSVFVDVPFRAINPQVNANAIGLGDVQAGFKYALYNDCHNVLTFQVRNYFPSGDSERGLGTNHYSVEPALLFYHQRTDRIFFEGEVRDWIGIEGSDFTGNVLRYGLGVSVLAYEANSFWLQPVAEVVGWTFLSGKQSAADYPVQSAKNDTIVNAKLGLRIGFGCREEAGFRNQSDMAISYGRALTGEVLYKDIARVELRIRY